MVDEGDATVVEYALSAGGSNYGVPGGFRGGELGRVAINEVLVRYIQYSE